MFTEINETANTSVKWCSISNGLICIKADEKTPGAKSRVNKLGNQVWEKFYKSIAGNIVGLGMSENKFGEREIRVRIENGDSVGILTIKADSSYGRGFFNQIFNVDLRKQVEFCPWQKITEDGSKRTNLYLNYQKRDKVEYKLPNGCPELIFHEIKGKKVLDVVSKAKQDEFLETELNKFILKNNLTFVKEATEKVEERFELTPEEAKELSNLKKKNKSKVDEINDLDDFFNE